MVDVPDRSDSFALYQNIPAEIRQRDQWVLWRREVRLEKTTKVPYSAHSRGRASSTNRNTWASFEDVVNVRRAHTRLYDGIGFVLSPDDPYVGVDLDHCVDLHTRIIDDWAVDVIYWLPSYTEVTPSFEGLRIILKGILPPGGRKHGPFEVYSEGRFLTITGDTLIGGPTEVNDCSEHLLEVHEQVFGKPEPERPPQRPSHFITADDHDLLDRAMNAANGERFRALWLGNRTGYASDSESDQALCSHLVFWCGGDTQRADALFRQSGLYREKWDERHAGDGRTYGHMTLAKALQGLAEVAPRDGGAPRGAFYGGVPL